MATALSIDDRAQRHDSLADPIRLAIVDELLISDRAPVELEAVTGVGSNLLAHHLDTLERAGLVVRSRSSGDGRRRYVHLIRPALAGVMGVANRDATAALFICTSNSARSQLAAALWTKMTGRSAQSAGTRPAEVVHPEAIRAAQRWGLKLNNETPRSLAQVPRRPPLVVTVCDRAHEEVGAEPTWWHWSIRDPLRDGSPDAFDEVVHELEQRIEATVGTGHSS
jgi:protein-tyrosine-phosphatase/DNA-binding transcriptional ArsR family regulator